MRNFGSCHKKILAGLMCLLAGVMNPDPAAAENTAGVEASQISEMRFQWENMPGAVQYEFVLLKGPENIKANVLLRQRDIYTNGVDVEVSRFRNKIKDCYWKVCALDFHGNYMGSFTDPQPVTGAEINPPAPKPTTEFEKMDYMPMYPVYSWIPQVGVKAHEVEVYRQGQGGDVKIRTLEAGEYDVYEYYGYTQPGEYYWRVRSVQPSGARGSWSEPSRFSIGGGPTPIAALGDSITHGGGAVSVPPGYTMYNWETYSSVPIKNLGLSGNTTAAMLERFEDDVLPWKPRVLVIMGGVNDFRDSTLGWSTVQNLAAIRDKCHAYGIIPVFLTATPINAYMMVHRIPGIAVPPSDWQVHQQYVNEWVLSQPYSIDVSSALTDAEGNLRAEYTSDGLHPDYIGKKHIGELVGTYLQQHFGWLTHGLSKK